MVSPSNRMLQPAGGSQPNKTFRPADELYMRRVLALARQAEGRTWPNPMVGAVLVRNGRIVGEGWHHRAGEPHAEILALRRAGKKSAGATLYINLEPCAHYGRTPPCSLAVIAGRVKRVVAAIRDPNPKVAGKGFAQLRKAGIRVDVGLLAAEARELNEVFLKKITTGLPFIICKAALSLDGKIATQAGASQWITGLPARRSGHRLRALADAVLIGAGTALADDPKLNVRLAPLRRPHAPVRIVLEGRRPMRADLKLWQSARRQPVVLATSRRTSPLAGLPGVQVWSLPGQSGRVDIAGLLQRLGRAGANLVLVEGGAEVHASFLGLQQPGDRIWADRIYFYYAPKILGGRAAPGPVGGRGVGHPGQALLLKDVKWERLGQDLLLKATPRKP